MMDEYKVPAQRIIHNLATQTLLLLNKWSGRALVNHLLNINKVISYSL